MDIINAGKYLGIIPWIIQQQLPVIAVIFLEETTHEEVTIIRCYVGYRFGRLR